MNCCVPVDEQNALLSLAVSDRRLGHHVWSSVAAVPGLMVSRGAQTGEFFVADVGWMVFEDIRPLGKNPTAYPVFFHHDAPADPCNCWNLDQQVQLLLREPPDSEPCISTPEAGKAGSGNKDFADAHEHEANGCGKKSVRRSWQSGGVFVAYVGDLLPETSPFIACAVGAGTHTRVDPRAWSLTCIPCRLVPHLYRVQHHGELGGAQGSVRHRHWERLRLGVRVLAQCAHCKL